MLYLTLFYEFFKTGLFAIGGGLATLPFLYDMADKYPWFDRQLLADMIAISESTPGPIGINMATYAGFHAGGVLGGFIATVALVLPSIIIVVLIAKFLSKFSENKFVKGAFYGIRPAVTALIALACFEIYNIAFLTIPAFSASHIPSDLLNWKAFALFVLLFVQYEKFKKHPIIYIGEGAVLGIIFSL